MSIVSKPNTFSPSTTISSSEMNDNFDTIFNEFNGNIAAANLATDSVTTAKIADSNVTTVKIADSNVTTAKLANANVTPDKLATGAAEGYVATAETCVNTAYVDCTTTTDTVTVTIGANGLAQVSIGCRVSSDTADSFNYMSFVVSGATTVAVGTNGREVLMQTSGANRAYVLAQTFLLTGLTAGSNTFKLKYKVANGGGGTGTATFSARRIAVIPL